MITLVDYDEDGDCEYRNCFNLERPLPPYPTRAIPGTEEKVQVMSDRWNAGYAVHHPDDIKISRKGIECYAGMGCLAGIVRSLEQMRVRGRK